MAQQVVQEDLTKRAGGEGANGSANGTDGGAGVQNNILGTNYYWGGGGGGAEHPDGTDRSGQGGLGGGGGGASSGSALELEVVALA